MVKTKLIEWSRTLLISPELAAVLAVAAGGYWWPSIPVRLAQFAEFHNLDVWVLALAAAPLTLVGVTYGYVLRILHPDNGRSSLAAWPDYWRLKIQALAALIWAGLGATSWIVGGLLVRAGFAALGATLAVSGLCSAVIATITSALARIEVQDALDGAPTGDT